MKKKIKTAAYTDLTVIDLQPPFGEMDQRVFFTASGAASCWRCELASLGGLLS